MEQKARPSTATRCDSASVLLLLLLHDDLSKLPAGTLYSTGSGFGVGWVLGRIGWVAKVDWWTGCRFATKVVSTRRPSLVERFAAESRFRLGVRVAGREQSHRKSRGHRGPEVVAQQTALRHSLCNNTYLGSTYS
jgi:hypothetical protein